MTRLVILTPDADGIGRHIAEALPGLEIVTPPATDSALVQDLMRGADCLLAWRFSADLIAGATRLRWIMSYGAGVDHLVGLDIPPSVTITRIQDAFGPAMAEYVLAYCYAIAQSLRRVMDQQRAADWKPFSPALLRGSTAVVVGLGSIGREVCRLLRVAGLQVIGVSRNGAPVTEADQTHSVADLDHVLPLADFLVLVLPLTPASHGLIGARQLALLKSTAWLINIARGPIVDEPALLASLNADTIGGAVLDVFQREPLPSDHPFWSLQNVIVTPHISGPDDNSIIASQFVTNYPRFLVGQPLLGTVDRVRGY